MKSAIIAVLLATAIASPASAGNWLTIERPCGSKCTQPSQVSQPPALGSLRFHSPPNYESRSRMVIQSRYGTSVINSTYRSYSR